MKIEAIGCGREADLLGFLYGELNEREANAFERHLDACDTCNSELAAFGTVRESVVAWRNESLRSIGFPTHTTDSSANSAARSKRSAVTALREFFNLSPLWMKGAVAFAAIMFCVFAGLALARLRESAPAPVALAPASSTHSQQELKALVDQRVQEELIRIRNSEASASPITANAQKNPAKRFANRNAQVALSAYSQKARRPLSKTEREQLANDLRLVSGRNDGDLYLLDDRINQ